MWIFTKIGFYSIASASKKDGAIDTDMVMIRARNKRHLENLKKRFPDINNENILHSGHTDYQWRVVVSKDRWVRMLEEMAREQAWSNFKDEAASAGEPAYVDALHKVWEVMYSYGKSLPS